MNRLTDQHDHDDDCKTGNLNHCLTHDVDEECTPESYTWCAECWHIFPTVADLLADHAALVERLNAHPINPPPGFSAPPLVAKTDPDQIWSCPHCAHDF